MALKMTLYISLQVIFWIPKIQKGSLVWKGTNHLTFVLTYDMTKKNALKLTQVTSQHQHTNINILFEF